MNRRPLLRTLLAAWLVWMGWTVCTGLAFAQPDEPPALPAPIDVDTYIERTFAVFPSQAIAAGRHDVDQRLEDLAAETRAAWVDFNRHAAADMALLLDDPKASPDDRLDAELIRRQALLEIFDHEVLRRPERDPLYWTGLVSNAVVFLLVRRDLDRPIALTRAAARARQIPRLVAQARQALGSSAPAELPRERVEIAAHQARASARFFRDGFADAASDLPPIQAVLRGAGAQAADALFPFADFLDTLAAEASGSPRLGPRYAERFRLATGLETPVADILARAEGALEAKRAETAEYGRDVWPEIFADTPPPDDDHELVRRLFARVAEDRIDAAREDVVDVFVEQYRTLVDEVVAFVRQRDILTLPEPLTLWVGRSPSYFVGQAVGGVYPAGPWSPEAETLLFLPTPPGDATTEQKDAFLRDFNNHFNRMITPHELIPGHYLQLKWAARHPRKARALFADGVYVEGWGTFCERLLLDLGWGGPLDRLAHLKKQLENISRTIVDIRVHTRGMTRGEVLRFVQEDALQDAQFAGNMWTRSILSAPQLTTYFLGYDQVWGLYEDVRAARGGDFVLKEFLDGMMELGPVAVERYRERMFGVQSPEGSN